MNTSILTPDENKGETIDTPKKFKNIDTEDFEFSWDDIKTIVPAGQTKDLPLYKVNYAAMHLARKIYKRKIFEGKSEAERSIGIVRFVNPEEEWKLQQQMVADNFPQEIVTIGTIPQEIKPGEIIPPIKEKKEEEIKQFKCEICGFIAKSEFGLLIHKNKKHK